VADAAFQSLTSWCRHLATDSRFRSEDSAFFTAWHGLRLATTQQWGGPSFENGCACYFVEVEVFTPELARRTSRLAFTSLLE
jgi:hypothetical protein